jgi:type VI secretion system secreted protein VgrG
MNNSHIISTRIIIDRDEIEDFNFKVNIIQKVSDHNTFEVICPTESLEGFGNYPMTHARDFLGKQIVIKFEQFGKETYSFSGLITDITNEKCDGSPNIIILSGYSPTILLDNGLDCQSYEKYSLSNIIQQATRDYPQDLIKFKLKPNYDSEIPYTVQYRESDFQFIKRLAVRYGEWFYYNGREIVFGNISEEIIDLEEESEMFEYKLKMQLIPQKFSYIAYHADGANSVTENANASQKKQYSNSFVQDALESSEKFFKKTPSSLHNHSLLQNGTNDLRNAVQLQKDKRANVFYVEGKSHKPELRLGVFIKMSAYINAENDLSKTVPLETYRIVSITKTYDGMGGYHNTFVAVPYEITVPDYMNDDAVPQCEDQSAIVVNNNDPGKMSRIQVQFAWQKQMNQVSPWLRVITPYAGNGKGMHALPEIGEEVLVSFENNNAEKPYVLGALFNGQAKSGHGGEGNFIKGFQTASGIKIILNDDQKSVLVEDPSGNKFFMDGNKNMILTAVNRFTINGNDIEINAFNNLEINVANNMIMNVMTKLFVFTPQLKQVVSGFMSLFSGKALINSNNTINIEAKEFNAIGIKKMFLHSEESATINSKGKTEIHGTSGNNLTNTGQNKKVSATEEISLAIVEFRTLATHKGEFGFDWLRQKDNSLNLEPDYETIIKGGYKDGTTDLTKLEAFTALKGEYEQIPVKRKSSSTGVTPPLGEYFVPYLNLFPKPFSDTFTTTPKPPFEATLRILVEIEKDLNRLEFDYDKTVFIIDKPILSDKNKTSGLVNSQDVTVKITCVKEITTDVQGEIRIYAYPKKYECEGESDQKEVPMTPGEEMTARRLAGKIIVGRNDASQRKEQKFVLTSIWTDIRKSGRKLKGSFTSDEKINFCNALYQGLIIPILEDSPNVLDVSSNVDFQTGGKYIDSSNKINEDVSGFFTDVKKLFLDDKDSAGILKNDKYKTGYFTVFSLAAQVYDGAKGQIDHEEYVVGGKTKMKFLKNLILFPNKDFCTMNHEGLHGMGLRHSHADSLPIDEPDIKYVFPNAISSSIQPIGDQANSTDNVMCYRNVAYTTWQWQWTIMRNNV